MASVEIEEGRRAVRKSCEKRRLNDRFYTIKLLSMRHRSIIGGIILSVDETELLRVIVDRFIYTDCSHTWDGDAANAEALRFMLEKRSEQGQARNDKKENG